MAGSVVNAASVASATTALSCAMPTGTVQGDVMVAAVCSDWDTYANVTAPAGWTLRTGQDGGSNNIHLKVFTKTAGASEAGPYAFGQGASSDGTAAIVALRGVDESTAVGLYGSTLTVTTSSTRTAPTITGATTGAVLVCGAMTDGSASTTTWTPPAGMTEQADVQSATFTTESIATLLNPGSPTGTKDFTCTGTPTATGGIQWSAVFNATTPAEDPPPWAVRSPGLFRAPGGRGPQPWFGVADVDAAAVVTTAEQGSGTAGLATTGTAVKVAKVVGVTGLGLAATGTARKSTAQAGTVTVAATATGGAKKVAPHTGTAALGTAGAGVDRKVTVSGGSGALGTAGAGTDKKVATPTGTGAAGLSSTALESGAVTAVRAPSVWVLGQRVHPGWRALPNQALITGVIDTTPPSSAELGSATLALTTRAVVTKVAVVGGRCSVAAAGAVTAKKLGAQAGAAALGVAPAGTEKKSAPAAGTATLGGATAGAAKKVAAARGTATAGFAATRSGFIVRALQGSCALGGAARGTNAKRAQPTGIAAPGFGPSSGQRKVAGGTGATGLGVVCTGLPRHVQAQRGALGIGFAPESAAARIAIACGFGATALAPVQIEHDPVEVNRPLTAADVIDDAVRHRAGATGDLTAQEHAGANVDLTTREHAGGITDIAERYYAGVPT